MLDSNAAENVLPKLADSLKEIQQQRKSIVDDVETMLDDHPLCHVLMSMPGVGVRTAARIPLEVGDGSVFTSAADRISDLTILDPLLVDKMEIMLCTSRIEVTASGWWLERRNCVQLVRARRFGQRCRSERG